MCIDNEQKKMESQESLKVGGVLKVEARLDEILPCPGPFNQSQRREGKGRAGQCSTGSTC